MKLLTQIVRIVSELRLLGWRGSYQRIVFEFKRRTGIDILIKRPINITIENYLKAFNHLIDNKVDDQYSYLDFWKKNRNSLGFPNTQEAQVALFEFMSPLQKKVLHQQALLIQNYQFLHFSHHTEQYQQESLWYFNPEDASIWPKIHSSKILLHLEKYGDIKLVWEVGRFAWAITLVRAWLMDHDDRHIDCLFYLIEDFAKKNPLYIGPQWASEQEVAIRALALIYVQEILSEQNVLTEKRIQLLHTLLFFHGKYLNNDLEYAEIAIRNNHLINGAVGLYAIGNALSWHSCAQSWCNKAKRILEECLNEQWTVDGGYIQPSHNYHRSAWHGMLWARLIAQSRSDLSLVNLIKEKSHSSFIFFISQIDNDSGRMANWGPNDGALIASWTACDYSDYRPLVQTLAELSNSKLAFPQGAWDEDRFWFLGVSENKNVTGEFKQENLISFPLQGLHVIRPSEGNFAVMRCGSVTSRYGQQADQLHVDIWKSGLNLALDAGSYNYNKNQAIHNWFRGTFSHNTVIIDEQDQMIAHRKFKYIRWTKALAKPCNILNAQYAIVGVHHGYTRLKAGWIHARLLVSISNQWLVVDRVWPMRNVELAIKCRLHWQLALGKVNFDSNIVELEIEQKKYYFSLLCSQRESRLKLSQGVDGDMDSEEMYSGFDGWHSRYYNFKEAIPALNFSASILNECLFVTTIGDAPVKLELNTQEKILYFDGQSIPLNVLYDDAELMIKSIL